MKPFRFPPLALDETITRAHLLACFMRDTAGCEEEFEGWDALVHITHHEYSVSRMTIWRPSKHAQLGQTVLRTSVRMQDIRKAAADLFRQARKELHEEILEQAIEDLVVLAKKLKHESDYDDTSRKWVYWYQILQAIGRYVNDEPETVDSRIMQYDDKLHWLLQDGMSGRCTNA